MLPCAYKIKNKFQLDEEGLDYIFVRFQNPLQLTIEQIFLV